MNIHYKYIIAAALGNLAFPCHSARPPTLVNLTQPNLTSPLCLPLETMPTSNSPLSLFLSVFLTFSLNYPSIYLFLLDNMFFRFSIYISTGLSS